MKSITGGPDYGEKKNHPATENIEPYRYVRLMDFIAEQKEVLNLKI